MCGKNMEKIKKFPKRKMFYNYLLQKPCSKSEYEYAKKVWSTFEIENLKQYTKLYNHCDVLLLAEAFYLYRKVILKSFNLDPSHFYGIPSLSYNIMLKFSKIKLEHLSNPKMNDWFRSSIRGGVAFIKKRYENGDSTFTGQGYQKFIKYIDATNLYGSMMTFKLPYQNFKFLSHLDLKLLEQKLVNKEFIDVDGPTSYFVECDLLYPPDLHEIHNQWPLAPDKYEVTHNDLSLFSIMQLSFCDSTKFRRRNFSETKLIPHFHPRKNYICHIKNLIFYIKKGMILEKLHAAVSFSQKAWLKDYISHVAHLRSIAKENNQDFFVLIMKFIANNTFGKFCQNPENYRHFEMARTSEHLKKLSASPNFISQRILSENLVLCEMIPEKLEYKFQYAVASTILEFAKLFMYEFWYDILLPHFHPDVPELIMTDTDSILFSIKCEHFIDKYKTLPMMDFSNFPKDHVLYNNQNKMKLLHFKDEFPQHCFITEFVGLRAKLYCYRTTTTSGETTAHIKAKGYNSYAASQNLTFEKYLQCQETFKTMKFSYRTFRGYDFSLFTIEQLKNVLSNFDSKLYVHSCNIHTTFYGSILINPRNSDCYSCKKKSVNFPIRVNNH